MIRLFRIEWNCWLKFGRTTIARLSSAARPGSSFVSRLSAVEPDRLDFQSSGSSSGTSKLSAMAMLGELRADTPAVRKTSSSVVADTPNESTLSSARRVSSSRSSAGKRSTACDGTFICSSLPISDTVAASGMCVRTVALMAVSSQPGSFVIVML